MHTLIAHSVCTQHTRSYCSARWCFRFGYLKFLDFSRAPRPPEDSRLLCETAYTLHVARLSTDDESSLGAARARIASLSLDAVDFLRLPLTPAGRAGPENSAEVAAVVGKVQRRAERWVAVGE